MWLMNKNLWEIVKGTETSPKNPNELLEQGRRDNKDKAVIGLTLSDFELHHINLEK